MIGYFLFIVLFVFSKDNHCYEEPNIQCEKIVNLPYDSPDFNQVIEPESFPEERPDFIPVTMVESEELHSNDFDNTMYLQDLEHGILVKAYDLRFSLFPENNTDVREENNSIAVEMNRNNFIFQIYS